MMLFVTVISNQITFFRYLCSDGWGSMEYRLNVSSDFNSSGGPHLSQSFCKAWEESFSSFSPGLRPSQNCFLAWTVLETTFNLKQSDKSVKQYTKKSYFIPVCSFQIRCSKKSQCSNAHDVLRWLSYRDMDLQTCLRVSPP